MGRYHNGRLKEVTMDRSEDDVSYTRTKSKKSAKKDTLKGTNKNPTPKSTSTESATTRKRAASSHTPRQTGETTAPQPPKHQALGMVGVKDQSVAFNGLNAATSATLRHEQGLATSGPDIYAPTDSSNIFGEPSVHNVLSYNNATVPGFSTSDFGNFQHMQYHLASNVHQPFATNNFNSYFEEAMDTMYPDGNAIDITTHHHELAGTQIDSQQYGYNPTDMTTINTDLYVADQGNTSRSMPDEGKLTSLFEAGAENLLNGEVDTMAVDMSHQDVGKVDVDVRRKKEQGVVNDEVASPSPCIESDYEESDNDNSRPTKFPKLNKDGVPRKPRRPRPKLLKWSDNDWKNVALGIVWSCGENGIQIPFAQASQVVGQSCTAGALQQALLKLRGKQIAEGYQIPTLKMAWTRKHKDAACSSVNTDLTAIPDAITPKTHLVRKKPTRQQVNQSWIIGLKRAYNESDRSHLVSPYKPGQSSKKKSTMMPAPIATGLLDLACHSFVKVEDTLDHAPAWAASTTFNAEPTKPSTSQPDQQGADMLATPASALQIKPHSYGPHYPNLLLSSQSTDFMSTLPGDSQYQSTDMSQSFSLPMTPTSLPSISNVNTPGTYLDASGLQCSPTAANFQAQWSSQNDQNFSSPLYSPINFGPTIPSTPIRCQRPDNAQSLLRRDDGATSGQQSTRVLDQGIDSWIEPFAFQSFNADNPFVQALKTGSFYQDPPGNNNTFDFCHYGDS